jgi:hypothetical protein
VFGNGPFVREGYEARWVVSHALITEWMCDEIGHGLMAVAAAAAATIVKSLGECVAMTNVSSSLTLKYCTS